MSSVLVRSLLDSAAVASLGSAELNQLIPQGRVTDLLATLALRLQQADKLQQVPPHARRHLESAIVVHRKQRQDLAYEIKWLRRALAPTGQPLVLLKGAAYLQAGLPWAQGRMLSDIDLLVPAHAIGAVEAALNASGWQSGTLDAYNERYYRKWMHEIPPMAHPGRRSTLDLHHTILPPTAAPRVDASLLLRDIQPVQEGLFTLAPADMVIHSATHLFHEGEFRHGLRDLWDLDRMLRDFAGQDPEFWRHLVPRAEQLDLLDSLFHGLNYSRQVFGTPVPSSVVSQAENWRRRLRKPLMDFLFTRALQPDQPECRRPGTALALNALYVRSHYLRMPVHLLLPHLLRKGWMRHFTQPADGEPVAGKQGDK